MTIPILPVCTLALLAGVIVGASLDHHAHLALPAKVVEVHVDPQEARDACLEMAARTQYPVMYVDGRGCLVLVTPIKGAQES